MITMSPSRPFTTQKIRSLPPAVHRPIMSQRYFYFEKEIFPEGSDIPIGHLKIGLYQKTLFDNLWKSILSVVASILLVILFLTSGAALIVRRTLIQPIQVLREKAEQLTGGEFRNSVELNRNDELGELAHSFEEMRLATQRRISALNHLKDELQELNSHLEEKVSQRTEDLETSLKKLEHQNTVIQEMLLDADRQNEELRNTRTKLEETQKIAELTQELELQKIKLEQNNEALADANVNMAELYEQLEDQKISLQENNSALAEANERMTKLYHELSQSKEVFQKFVPKQFLDRIAKEGVEKIELGKAESDTISILFSDIRSFTKLSESLNPQELLNLLNAYFKRMGVPIKEHDGFIDKFIGDAIMALFDSPDLSDREEALNAIEASIEMHRHLNDYNRHRESCGYVPIEIGIGIHTGKVIIGTVGTVDRMESTVLGDVVNVASRLEGLTKHYRSKIIVSEANEKFHRRSI